MKKVLKKVSLLAAFTLCFNFCGCNSDKNDNKTKIQQIDYNFSYDYDELISGVFEYYDIEFKLAETYGYNQNYSYIMSNYGGIISLNKFDCTDAEHAQAKLDSEYESYEKFKQKQTIMKIDDIDITELSWEDKVRSGKLYLFILNNDCYAINFSADKLNRNDCSIYSKSDIMINSLCFDKQETTIETPIEKIPKQSTKSSTEELILDSKYTLYDITLKICNNWRLEEKENQDCCYLYTENGNFIMLSCDTANYNFDSNDQTAYLEGFENSGFEILESENTTLPGISDNVLKIRQKMQGVTFTNYTFLINRKLYVISGTEDVGGSTGNLNYLEKVVNSIEINETELVTELQTEKEEITLGMRNALESAKSYIKHSNFSYSGLIGQLEYEEYSQEEAKYGADNCGADWNEEALESAKSYIKHSSFSYSGLYEQLLYEEFTEKQAQYGVDNCDADWMEEAAECAKSYNKHSSFSSQELYDQLIFEGFTEEQAEYGVDAVGY